MGIDIFYINSKKQIDCDECLWTMENEDITILSPIFSTFEKKTGYILDEYGDLILSVGALKILLKLIEKSKQSESLFKFKKIVKDAVNDNRKLAFYGD